MKNIGVRWGLLAGIGIVILDLILYIADPKTILGLPSYLEWLVYLYAMYKAGMDRRNELGGYISWGEALKTTFITFVVASLFYTIFMWLLFNVIDPGMADLQREVAMEGIEMARSFVGEETYDEMIAGIEGREFGMTFSNSILSYAFRLIFPGFLFAALISLVVRRNPPEEVA